MDIDLINKAYRKLKGSIYLDKTLPFLRMRISEYEKDDIKKKLGKIYEAINDEEKWVLFEKNILNSIKVLTFPKEIADKNKDKNKDEPIIISNISGEDVTIQKYNNFIDMSVEGHVISILWILTIGYKLDKELYQNCYGNRLKDNLIIEGKDTTASPNLFKPYYGQYETWRNQGLKKAQKTINSNKSVIITMLDLTRYFYNIKITDDFYRSMTFNLYDNRDEALNRINSCVYNIIKVYSNMCSYKKAPFLPIGFFPSNIISNFYLKKIDDKMRKIKNTVYYGRYVDDMILVTEVDKAADLKRCVAERGNQCVYEYMLNLLESAEILCCKENIYALKDLPELNFQKKKFRFFYVDKDSYDTIIEKIQNDIYENVSEFNYIPESMTAELDTDVLKLEREDTVNKLRGINKAVIDKYSLSKAIGKNILMSRFSEKRTVEKFARNLERILDHKEILNNYTLWESILNFYVINDHIEGIGYLSKAVCASIGHMDEEANKCNDYEYLKGNQIEKVGDSLIYFYFGCLTRATAISCGQEVDNIIQDTITVFSNISGYRKYIALYEIENIRQIRKAFINARMVNKNLLPVNIEDCMELFRSDNVMGSGNVFSLKQYLNSHSTGRLSREGQKFSPYILSPFDILYTMLINQIKDGRTELFSSKECIETLYQKYAENFDGVDSKYISPYIMLNNYDNENYIVKVNSKKKWKKLKIRIAVANVKMSETDVEDIFEGKDRNIEKRCMEIGGILNEAIRYKADILVFPEAYLPLEYLKILQSKVAAHNMVVIGGIEHIIHKKIVYNLTTTILPIKDKNMSYAVPFFHQKLYFSPHESAMLKGKGYKPASGQKHTLYKWNGIYFTTYCCYELTSISLRHTFQGTADIIFGVEWNKDTHYFGNIMEALSRDIYCYCVQANMSEYGDSRIIQPTKKDYMNILRVKGGINATVLIGEIDIQELRRHQKNMSGGSDKYKPLPAGWDLFKVNRK